MAVLTIAWLSHCWTRDRGRPTVKSEGTSTPLNVHTHSIAKKATAKKTCGLNGSTQLHC